MNTSVIGDKANATRPEIEQIMLACPAGMDGEALERLLFLCRKRIERRVAEAAVSGFYICSFSAKSLIYKGMFLAEHIDEFYPDLTDQRFAPPWRCSTSAIRPTPSRMAPRPAVPHAGPQRRDQHAEGQHQLDEEP